MDHSPERLSRRDILRRGATPSSRRQALIGAVVVHAGVAIALCVHFAPAWITRESGLGSAAIGFELDPIRERLETPEAAETAPARPHVYEPEVEPPEFADPNADPLGDADSHVDQPARPRLTAVFLQAPAPFTRASVRGLKSQEDPPPPEVETPSGKTPPPTPATAPRSQEAALVHPTPLAAHRPLPAYSVHDSFYARNRELVVVVFIDVNADGRPVGVRVTRSSGSRKLDRRVRRTILERWRFEPARRNGRPVTSGLSRRFVFRP